MKNLSCNKGKQWCLCKFIFVMLLSNPMLAAELADGCPTKQIQHPITGTVSDAAGLLPGVTVVVKGTTISTLSDEKGNFSIRASASDILIFSFLGYATHEIAVGNQTSIQVQLSNDSTQLKEVFINAGYYTVKDKERTGSIERITAKDIEKQPVSNVLATLQGRMAGVNVTQTTGVPGGGFDIQIRGQNSLRTDGNSPLYIINGVPYSSETIGYSQTSNATPSPTSPLNSINPADIESIEVLKDADATAIYGSRGANGVILITTKKAKVGKTAISLQASTAVGTVTRFIDLMNTEDYVAMRRQAFANDGITTYPANAYDINGTWDQNRNTNWQNELLGGTAEITNVQTSVSGSTALTQFLLSGTFRNETTVFPGDFSYKKGGINCNINHISENKKLKITFLAGYTLQGNDQPGFDLTRIAATIAPNAPALYKENRNLNWENGTFQNPLSNLDMKFKSVTTDLIANSVLSYQLSPALELKSSFGFTDLKNDERRTVPSTIYNPAYNIGPEYSSLFTNQTKRQSWIVEPQINFHKDFSHDKLDILVGTTFQSQESEVLYALGSGFSTNNLINDLASATYKIILSSAQNVYKYQAFFARINYNWKGKYIFNITGRRDGSSRFGPKNKFANFGAMGAAWLFSNEPGIKEILSFLSFGKIRGSYGTTGNDQIGDYQFLDTYSSTGNNYQGVVGLQPSRLFNPNFGWEKNKKIEIALELGLINDRVFLTSAWYLNRSSNQLVGVPLPSTTGFPTLNGNLNATVENRGYEFTVRTVNFQNPAFSWSTNFNISTSRNKLVSFPDLPTSPYSQSYVIGQSLNIQKAYYFIGLNPKTGIYEFEDVNHDGIISAPDDKQTVLDFTPQFFGGIQNQITYRGWQLDFLFQFVKQNNWDYSAGAAGGMYNQPSAFSTSWQKSGDQALFQQFTSGTNSAVVQAYSNYTLSNAGVVDASYMRLKNFALSFDLPIQFTKDVRCRFSLQGQNILTFTKYKNGDPEFRNPGYLPPLKIYSIGVQLNF